VLKRPVSVCSDNNNQGGIPTKAGIALNNFVIRYTVTGICMALLIVVIGCGGGGGTVRVSGGGGVSVEDDYADGRMLMAQGNYTPAITSFQKVLDKTSEGPFAEKSRYYMGSATRSSSSGQARRLSTRPFSTRGPSRPWPTRSAWPAATPISRSGITTRR